MRNFVEIAKDGAHAILRESVCANPKCGMVFKWYDGKMPGKANIRKAPIKGHFA